MPYRQRSRAAGLLFIVIAHATTLAPHARAQTPPHAAELVRLENIVVSAARTPQDPRFTPSAVTAIEPAELAASQVTDLRTALAAQPGVVVVSSGATGGQSTIYLRGANADQVLLFVDGVRMNSTDAGYANFLGGADVLGVDRLEILRGPQSTLYGSSAIGGVITLDTTHGCGPLSGTIGVELGSFDTFSANVAIQGGTARFGYSASLANVETDNDRPDNAYRQTSYTTRLEFLAVPQWLVGMTVRGQVGRYDEAGSEQLPAQGRLEAPNHLVTAYTEWRPVDDIRSRLTAAWHQTEYDWKDKFSSASDFYTRNTRRILEWQNSWQAATWATFVAGASAEWAHYTSGGETLNDDQRGIYASALFRPIAPLTLDVGVRNDDHDLEGRVNTWHAGAAHRIEKTSTKLRATYGTGFKAPSMINRFGSPPWFAPSPNIRPEESRGWDVGLDQSFGKKLELSATYFRNEFSDLIESVYVSSLGKFVATNLNEARTDGLEFALTARPIAHVKIRAAYTYLTALDTSDPAQEMRVARRPRHIGDMEIQVQPAPVWMVGAGVHVVAGREDNIFDVSTFSSKQIDVEDYTVARVFASYQVRSDLVFKLRVENALNEKYSESFGYPALPRGVFTTVEWKF